MNSVSAEVGIDVSKPILDVSLDGSKVFRVSNTQEGCEELVQRLPPGSRVHLESSGGYERLARKVLRQAGFQVETHDPLKVRRFAQSQGRNGKTDALDAKHLSTNGSRIKPQEEKSDLREQLCDFSRGIQELKATASQLKVRAARPGVHPHVRAALLESANAIHGQIQKLEREFVRKVKASPLKRQYELALTVPGVGPCLARVLVSELPEDLSKFTSQQITAYAGVAPIDDTSGSKKKPARIRRGNAHLKAALYMPALSVLHSETWAREHYAKLRAKGKVHQQAAIALMRRLLTRIAAVLKRGSPWQGEPQRA
jgi:transposase